jgi:hypothetical protein
LWLCVFPEEALDRQLPLFFNTLIRLKFSLTSAMIIPESFSFRHPVWGGGRSRRLP